MKKILACLVVCLMIPELLIGCGAKETTEAEKNEVTAANAAIAQQNGLQAGNLLTQSDLFPAGSSVSDWLAMCFALGGAEEDYDAYLRDLQDYVERQYAEKGCLSDTKATEYHRIAMTVRALGGDPTAFGKAPDGHTIDLVAEGTYAYAGDLGKQGLNGWIWALLALDCGNYAVPDDATYSRETICGQILANQETDGGFGLMSGTSDVDITAMALQALAPYREQYAEQLECALDYLGQQMNDAGGFVSFGAESAETEAQVLIALTALGIDPAKDERFCRQGVTPAEGLTRFLLEDGTYTHTLNDPYSDVMATEQALLAVLACRRMERDGGRLYDFT